MFSSSELVTIVREYILIPITHDRLPCLEFIEDNTNSVAPFSNTCAQLDRKIPKGLGLPPSGKSSEAAWCTGKCTNMHSYRNGDFHRKRGPNKEKRIVSWHVTPTFLNFSSGTSASLFFTVDEWINRIAQLALRTTENQCYKRCKKATCKLLWVLKQAEYSGNLWGAESGLSIKKTNKKPTNSLLPFQWK